MKSQPELKGEICPQLPLLSMLSHINEQLPSYFPNKDQFIALHPVLPLRFKVKLLAYLSRFCSVSFCANYHKHNLYNLGMGKKQIQNLLNLSTPIHENDLKVDLRVLRQSNLNQLTQNQVEKSLLRCAVLMFFQPAQATTYRLQVRRFLGRDLYDQLVTYLSYLKFCYQWIESYPELFSKKYQNNQEILETVYQKEPLLKDFFQRVNQGASDGQVYAILSIYRDITELINTQKSLSDRNNELEIINQELEQFSYSVSHDLQSPLRIIEGFSQILSKQYENDLDDTAKHYLQRIRANCQRMSQLIRDLLQLSRISRCLLHSQPINLSAIAEEIANELQTTNPERNVEFRITPNLISEGDPHLLYLVLQNLLQNAWKYTSHHSQALIEFGATVKEDGKKVYFVRDDGAGFEITYIDKLFQAFQRLHPESQFPGNGIGLATVKKIITRHGGYIECEGAIEKGATFYFTLS